MLSLIHFILELLAGLEGGYLRRGDLDLLVRSGIESRACGTIAALKCTEADQLYRAAGFDFLFHDLDRCVNRKRSIGFQNSNLSS